MKTVTLIMILVGMLSTAAVASDVPTAPASQKEGVVTGPVQIEEDGAVAAAVGGGAKNPWRSPYKTAAAQVVRVNMD